VDVKFFLVSTRPVISWAPDQVRRDILGRMAV